VATARDLLTRGAPMLAALLIGQGPPPLVAKT
jgi:hypothetical protein